MNWFQFFSSLRVKRGLTAERQNNESPVLKALVKVTALTVASARLSLCGPNATRITLGKVLNASGDDLLFQVVQDDRQ